MEIAVTGEGKTDYGMREYGCPTWKWGPIATYIRKVADKNDVSISLTPISREDISKIKIQRSMGSGLCGHGIPARKFTILMKLKGYDKGIPELLWGDVHDPKSNYPKNYLTRMIASCDKRYKNYSTSMDDFCNIAEATDIDTLRDTCRISFGKFCDDFDAL